MVTVHAVSVWSADILSTCYADIKPIGERVLSMCCCSGESESYWFVVRILR